MEDSLNEIRILASFKHPRLIRWYETFVESDLQELCIVMELCPYGDLEAKIKRHQHRKQYIDEREIWVYAVNLLEGLAALHAKGVVHRDLKPANCLIDKDGCVKIADMNISKVAKGGNMQTQVGTPYFICPEIYLKHPYSASSDLWSLGGVLYNLAALHPPFLADNIHTLKRAVIKGTYEPLPSVYGSSLTALIGKLLQVNPRDRPEAKDILKDPLVERHKYLLLHPLPSGAEDAEGEMLPTIRVASDKEGTRTIMLPGPAYEDEGEPGRPKTPRSPTSVFVVYSPRGKPAAGPASPPTTAASSSNDAPRPLQRPGQLRPVAQSPPPPQQHQQQQLRPQPQPQQQQQQQQQQVPSAQQPMRPPPSVAIPLPPAQKSHAQLPAPSAAGSPPNKATPLCSLLPSLQEMARHLPKTSPKEPAHPQPDKLNLDATGEEEGEVRPKRSSIRQARVPAFPTAEVKNFFANAKLPAALTPKEKEKDPNQGKRVVSNDPFYPDY